MLMFKFKELEPFAKKRVIEMYREGWEESKGKELDFWEVYTILHDNEEDLYTFHGIYVSDENYGELESDIIDAVEQVIK